MDPARKFTANEWNSLGWNGGRAYVANVRERMNVIGHGGRVQGRDGGREYRRGGGPCNVNELNSNNSGRHNEYQQGGQRKGQGHRVRHSRDKGGHNGTIFGRSDYH